METATEMKEALLPQLPSLHSAVSFRPALTQLQRQRKETAALRDLFHSLVDKRQRRQQELAALTNSRVKPSFQTSNSNRLIDSRACRLALPRTINTFDRISPAATGRVSGTDNAEKNDSGAEDKHFPSITAPGTAKDRTKSYTPYITVPSHRDKQTEPRKSMKRPSNNLRQDDVKSPVPYHTAITRRPVRTCSPTFHALIHFCSEPLPHLMDGSKTRSCNDQPSPKRDLKEWQNEIVKVVPSRPDFAQSLSPGARPAKTVTFRYPYKVNNFDPACHFYRSWSKVSDKEYVINPEWSSEKNLQHPGLALREKTL